MDYAMGTNVDATIATDRDGADAAQTNRDGTKGVSKGALWTGRVLSGLVVAFMLLDGAMKLAKPAPVVTGTVTLGYPVSVITPLGIVLLLSTIAYAIPRTAILGAILLTGYLGGAVASHVRVSDPLFSHTLFPIYFGVMAWAGLVLRDARLRALLPFRKPE